MRTDRLPQQIRLPAGSPLVYAPHNEAEVLFLFAALAGRRYHLDIENVQNDFPDCIARDRRSGKRVRVEFEFNSRSFKQHKHAPRGCDWLVCWIHDWPDVPSRLKIIELRREYGLGFNVWLQPVHGEFSEFLDELKGAEIWSVASQASMDDLVVFYQSNPQKYIRHVCRIETPVEYVRADWRGGYDWMADIRKICTLKYPVTLDELRGHPVLGKAGFVRANMVGRFKISAFWPEIYRLILDTNPEREKQLQHFSPERLPKQQ